MAFDRQIQQSGPGAAKNPQDYTHWFIFDGVGAVDGEMHTKYDRLLRAASWHEQPDYLVLAFDTKAWKNGETVMADVTAEVARDWWEEFGAADTLDKVRAGERPCFLADHCGREVELMHQEVYAAENAADRWHDEHMMAAE